MSAIIPANPGFEVLWTECDPVLAAPDALHRLPVVAWLIATEEVTPITLDFALWADPDDWRPYALKLPDGQVMSRRDLIPFENEKEWLEWERDDNLAWAKRWGHPRVVGITQ
jgi:hypothetical protein